MRTPISLIFLLFGFSIFYDAEAYPANNEPADDTVYNRQHCIQMTPENEQKITAIVTKISEYLYNLTIEYEVFDIRLLKIGIEAHLDDEDEEKDTEIQLVVNDCSDVSGGQDLQDNGDETIVIDYSDTEGQSNDSNSNNNSAGAAEYTGDDSESVVTDNNSGVDESAVNDGTSNRTNDNKLAGSNDDDSEIYSTNDNEQATSNDQSESYTTNDVVETSGIDVNDIQPSSDANFEVQGPVLVRLDLDKDANKLISGTQMKRGEHVPLILYIQKVLGNAEYLFGN